MFGQCFTDYVAVSFIILYILDLWYTAKCFECLVVKFIDVGEVWVGHDDIGQLLHISETVGYSVYRESPSIR